MKRIVIIGAFALVVLNATLLQSSIFPDTPDQAEEKKTGNGLVFVLPIQGDIEPSTAVFVQRRIKTALDAGARDIIFNIDTFGGRVDSALRVATAIGAVRGARTIAFVGAASESLGVSWSAGALIALSCAEIYMAPGTSIGAVAPVVMSGEGTMVGAGEKTVSAVRAHMAALAEKNGHPRGIALAMVDEDVELVEVQLDGETLALTIEDAAALEKKAGDSLVKVKVLSAKGKLLSLTAGEAQRLGLTENTTNDIASLMEILGHTGEPAKLEPSFADSLIVLLNTAAVQSLLILIGLIALFIEINSPGFGLPGSIALIAFLILFGSNMLMGTVGSLEIMLFLLGMGLLVVEIFVLPGFGVTGIAGIAFIALALVLSMQDFILPETDYQWDILARNSVTVGAGVLLGIIGIGAFIAVSPKLSLFKLFTLNTAITGTASSKPASVSPDTDGWPSVGDECISESVLRPSGRALFKGHSINVEAEGRFVEAGTPIRISAIRGGTVYVEPIVRPESI